MEMRWLRWDTYNVRRPLNNLSSEEFILGVEPVIEISLPDSIPHCNSSELRLSSERIQHVCHKPMKKGIPKTVILYQVGQPLVPKGFVYFFLRVLGCTAASLLPQQAKRTFRKFTTKPSEQVAAPPGNIFDYHFSLTTHHPCYVAGPSDNALVVDTTSASSSNSRRNSYRVVQLNFTPEIEVFYMLFDRYLSIFSLTSLKQHKDYFHLQCTVEPA